MPIYEYTCKACENKFDKLQRTMGAESNVPCPSCGSKKTTRSLGVFAVAAESSKSSGSTPPTCGRCGGAQGSCASERN